MQVLTVANLSKAYKQYPTLRSRLKEWSIGGRKTYHSLYWVLRDINFCVNKGEAVGLVGINGAGKSTLLKLITGTTRPTAGTISKHGTISALLELGLGFQPEFTGRENIFMASQLLGKKRKDILQLIPDIEDFAEISTFMDKPVRVFSSGMKMRLAFSIAIVIRPDLLIIDEALAVGDSYFQHKCLKRIRELITQGSALILVSHDNLAITSVCDRAILLNQGVIAQDGPAELVMSHYKALLADFNGKHVKQNMHPCGKVQTISGTQEVSLIDISLVNNASQTVQMINVGEAVKLKLKIAARSFLPELTVGFEIKDKYGRPVFGTNTYHLQYPLLNIKKAEVIEISFSFLANLGVGEYSISVALHEGQDHIGKTYEWREFALIFSVVNFDKANFLGTTWLPQQVSCQRHVNSWLSI
ncbi:MAG: sugar ABC transporter ATP-binding protein [Legionellales bacterium RIFCSPHIGHO2_12_FULL_37_14]|nr:MAG: sugar ABC transporter ATP-binding protein [Legionellales bacterium RIFCSPHIGHO2_12_FULL_37_14]